MKSEEAGISKEERKYLSIYLATINTTARKESQINKFLVYIKRLCYK